VYFIPLTLTRAVLLDFIGRPIGSQTIGLLELFFHFRCWQLCNTDIFHKPDDQQDMRYSHRVLQTYTNIHGISCRS